MTSPLITATSVNSVLECAMEWFEMFGSIVIQKEVAPSQSDQPERLAQVTPSQSDQPERPAQVTRVLTRRDTKKRVGIKYFCKPLEARESSFLEKNYSILDHPRSNPYAHEFSFPLVKKVSFFEGLEGQEELCFINNNGSWYKKEPNFQYNNYQQRSYPNNQQSGYPPRNNQPGSYQPQQNPSSGSSAPQESSTDTLLKQILESQTRSEKQVGYELKNLHSKIDGSYNELNNKFSHLTST
ncbi:hypothetical protein IGI04_022915, partial [Brassica rapa subsp. trilocularis]